MERPLTFHPLVQRDFNEIVEYYHEGAGRSASRVSAKPLDCYSLL